MKVAWVTDDAPDRGQGGTGIRQSHLLAALAARHECHLLSTGGPADELVTPSLASTQLLSKKTTWWPSTRAQRRLHDLWLAGPGGPSEVYLTAQSRAVLGPALRNSGPFDLIVVEHAGLAPLARDRRAGSHWALTLHNVASARATQQLAVTTGRVRTQLVTREIALTRALEAQALKDFDLVVVVSELDAELLDGSTQTVENGVDLRAFRPTPLPARPSVVFTGTLSYGPNVDGLLWFVETAWPTVLRQVPEAELHLVGRLPTSEVLALDERVGVQVHADVADVRPYLENARVALVPLRMGSGTRLKALEAMASGRPVVGTSIGLEGLPLGPGEALVADDPASLAAAVVAGLTDDALASGLAQRGRAYVEAHHDWTSIGARYVALLDELAQSTSRRARTDP